MFPIPYFFVLIICVQSINISKEVNKQNTEDIYTNAPEKISNHLTGTTKVNSNGSDLKKYFFPEFVKIATFLDPLSRQVENEECKKQLKIYINSLKNSSLWAVQMFDASAKVSQGLLSSDAYDLGNYDGCVDINLKTNKGDIFGKYCLAKLIVTKREADNQECPDEPLNIFTRPEYSAWEKLMVPVLKYGFLNNILRTAICVPNKCTPKDVEYIYNYLYSNITKIAKVQVEISVPENSCSTAESTHLKKETTLISQGILFIVIGITAITAIDLLGWCNAMTSGLFKILLSFSAYRNFKLLTYIDTSKQIQVLDSLKVYGLMFLVVNRRLSFFLNEPIINRKNVEQAFGDTFKERFFDISNNLIVDTFLVVTGFLHFYKVNLYLNKKPELRIRRIYLAQFLKSLPLYVLGILFYVYILEDLGDGPLWKERTQSFVSNCKKNWMINLLLLNNYTDVSKMCIFEAWYFAVIAHCFIAVPIVVTISKKTTRRSLVIIGLLTTAAFIVPLGMIYFKIDRSTSKSECRNVQWHQKISTRTSDRALSYVIGMGASFMYNKITEQRWNIQENQAKLYSLLTTIFGVIILSTFFDNVSTKLTILPIHVIIKLRQLLWCLSISWIIIGICTKKITTLTPILSQQCLTPFSRLSYPFLLIMGLVQLYISGTIRTLNHFSFSRLIMASAGDFGATYIFAFLFYMGIQQPITTIINERILGTSSIFNTQEVQEQKTSKCRKKIQ